MKARSVFLCHNRSINVTVTHIPASNAFIFSSVYLHSEYYFGSLTFLSVLLIHDGVPKITTHNQKQQHSLEDF